MNDNATIGCGCLSVVLVFVIVAVMSVLGSIAAFGGGAVWQYVTAPIRGGLDAREKTVASGAFRLEAYESFYNQCTSIQQLEKDVDGQIALLATSTNENDKRIINTNIAGVASARNGAVDRYNNDSHKQYTIAQFKSKALAYELPNAPYVTLDANGFWQKGNKTVCVVN